MTKLPFELQKALSGKYKIVTRDGREVDYIYDTGLDIDYPIMGHVKGSDYPYTYTKDGELVVKSESYDDLFLVEEKKKGWVVIYRVCDSIIARGTTGEKYKNQLEETTKANGTYLKTVEVEY